MRCVLHFVFLIVLFVNFGRTVVAVPPAAESTAEPQDKRVAADKSPEAVPPGISPRNGFNPNHSYKGVSGVIKPFPAARGSRLHPHSF